MKQAGNRSFGARRSDRPKGRMAPDRKTPRPSAAKVKQSKLPAGTTVTLPVARVTEYGYFLHDGETDILLHKNEATRQLHEGESVEVFLYNDHEGRLAATMEEPIVKMGEFGWLEVVDVVPRMGVYLNNGINRDVLLFIDDLPKMKNEWPQVGDMLLVSLKQDKEGRLLAQPVTEEVIVRNAKPASADMLNKQMDGTVYKLIGAGAFLLTEGEHILFIHRDEMPEPLRLGQTVQSRISFVREDGRLNGSLKARKEQLYREDADRLIAYMKENGDSMPFTDDTSPEEIKDTFGMSKSAFKRALGKLLKERRVACADGMTKLIP
ncbi:MAG: S1 RNA-binding domain-containing protein [Clostridia bacterium]